MIHGSWFFVCLLSISSLLHSFIVMTSLKRGSWTQLSIEWMENYNLLVKINEKQLTTCPTIFRPKNTDFWVPSDLVSIWSQSGPIHLLTILECAERGRHGTGVIAIVRIKTWFWSPNFFWKFHSISISITLISWCWFRNKQKDPLASVFSA